MIVISLLFVLTNDLASNFKKLIKNPLNLSFIGIFLIYLLSGLNSDDTAYFLERLKIKLPLLILPLGFSCIELSKKRLNTILYFTLILVSLFSVGSFINYLLNFKEVNESYLHAKVIPTPINHIRFSLLIAISIIAGFFLYRKKFILKWNWERGLILGCTLFLLVFLHILSVRSGMLAFYVSVFSLLVVYILRSGNYKTGIAGLLLVLSLPLAAYFAFPTLQNKINYSIADISRFIKGKSANNYSDGNRLLSLKLATEIAMENILTGVGIGDVKNKMFEKYEREYPDISPENKIIPHNQFFFIFAGAGFIGLFLFTLFTFYPIMNKVAAQNALFIAITATIVTSYISEATLENQLGMAIYSLFSLIAYQYNEYPDEYFL
ncbi:MAG TPA: O-antigen ligase family protein [Cytophagaceae bacterium]